MNLFELHDILSMDDLALCESVLDADPELRGLIDQQLTKPFQQQLASVKSQIVQTFVPKLKAWADEAIQTAKEGDGSYKFITKVLNNPETIAKQLLNTLTKQSKDPIGEEATGSYPHSSANKETWIKR